jgi:hypothetical protein
MIVARSSAVSACQAASKSKSGSPFAARSASVSTPSTSDTSSTHTMCSTPPRPWMRGRKRSSQKTTLLPALPNRYAICSGADVL